MICSQLLQLDNIHHTFCSGGLGYIMLQRLGPHHMPSSCMLREPAAAASLRANSQIHFFDLSSACLYACDGRCPCLDLPCPATNMVALILDCASPKRKEFCESGPAQCACACPSEGSSKMTYLVDRLASACGLSVWRRTSLSIPSQPECMWPT